MTMAMAMAYLSKVFAGWGDVVRSPFTALIRSEGTPRNLAFEGRCGVTAPDAASNWGAPKAKWDLPYCVT